MSTKQGTVYKTFNGRRYWVVGNQAPTDTTTKVIVSVVRNRTGVANPNWKTQIQNDTNAATPFSANEQTREASPFSGVIHTTPRLPVGSKTDKYEHYGNFSGWNVPSSIISAASTASLVEADKIALRNLHRKIKEVQHQFQGAVFAAQLGQAIRMVLTPAKTLRTSISSYFNALPKRVRGVKKQKVRKVIADTYLEYTFGWQPLLLDTKEAAIALARFVEERFEKSRFRVIGKDEKLLTASSFRSGFYTDSISFPFYYLIDNKRIGKAHVIYYGLFRGGVQSYDGKESPAGRLAALCGFDLQSFAPTVWECIPYSFVIDYFSNVGDVIDAHSYSTAAVRWLNKVEILSIEDITILLPDIPLTTAVTHGSNVTTHIVYVAGQRSVVKSAYKSVSRTRLEQVPFPTLRFEVPLASSMKWANLAALALGARSMSPFK